MAKPGGFLGDLGESFEQIGSDVVRETIQAPKDIVGTALESLGGSGSAKSQKQQTTQSAAQHVSEGGQSAGDQHSQEMKQAIARNALEEISGRKKQKEQTVWEKLQQEEEQKKQMEKKRKEDSRKNNLPQVSSKRKRGDLYGTKAKKTQTETGGNKRQD